MAPRGPSSPVLPRRYSKPTARSARSLPGQAPAVVQSTQRGARLFGRRALAKSLLRSGGMGHKVGRVRPCGDNHPPDGWSSPCQHGPSLKPFGWHVLRHTFASALVIKGASLNDVRELLGHTTMTMTLRYAHLNDQRKRDVVGLLTGGAGVVAK